jgi:phage host-nuclease inhibitor protein Gam
MPRTKPAALVLQSLDHVDQALRRLGEIDAHLERECLEHTTRVEEQKQQLLEAQIPILKERKRLEDAIESFATHQKEKLFPEGEKRSLELLFGSIGWRRSSVVTLERFCTPDYLRTIGREAGILTTERVSKAYFASLDEADLKGTGAKVRQKDTFYLELNHDQVKKALEAAQQQLAS